MSHKISSHTRVQVTVEIYGSSYGKEWTLDKLVEQSGREAVIGIKNMLYKNDCKIIGEPKVICISHMEE